VAFAKKVASKEGKIKNYEKLCARAPRILECGQAAFGGPNPHLLTVSMQLPPVTQARTSLNASAESQTLYVL